MLRIPNLIIKAFYSLSVIINYILCAIILRLLVILLFRKFQLQFQFFQAFPRQSLIYFHLSFKIQLIEQGLFLIPNMFNDKQLQSVLSISFLKKFLGLSLSKHMKCIAFIICINPCFP
ncbi:hypothetical protein FGO68_gene313 [Halteria grandinella]|uniref:Transmembrane protein n=1 Tax=Halteria grandinella TaxID=5974 RepID=A0A8J8P3M4_HALGN|nr:hypothetical protein FGO68_gene313 [Halteria grandinella]